MEWKVWGNPKVVAIKDVVRNVNGEIRVIFKRGNIYELESGSDNSILVVSKDFTGMTFTSWFKVDGKFTETALDNFKVVEES